MVSNSTSEYILALDLGTTGNRAILFDAKGDLVGQSYQELTQYYPQAGWLEHDPEQIWQDTCTCMQQVVAKTGVSAAEIAAIGLTVQRETCLLWDRTTGQPLHRAIVWQDRRTSKMCESLSSDAAEIQQRTGLVLDAYFSATKLAWLLDWVKQQDPKVNPENAIAGTVDTWILWKLTGGRVHATDHSNASRTMLMNLESLDWDPWLLDLFGIPAQMMPKNSAQSRGIWGNRCAMVGGGNSDRGYFWRPTSSPICSWVRSPGNAQMHLWYGLFFDCPNRGNSHAIAPSTPLDGCLESGGYGELCNGGGNVHHRRLYSVVARWFATDKLRSRDRTLGNSGRGKSWLIFCEASAVLGSPQVEQLVSPLRSWGLPK